MKKSLLTIMLLFFALSFSPLYADSPADRTMDGIDYSTNLTNGFFVSGIDFPAGEYDITITSENGEVSFFDENGNPLKPYSYNPETRFYEYINLPWNTYIKVVNGTVNLNSFNISGAALTPREQKIRKSYKFKKGNYISGSDFAAGTYDIMVNGKNISGTFSCNNPKMEMVSAPMDSRNYKIYKNIALPKGMQLRLENLDVKITPSK